MQKFIRQPKMWAIYQAISRRLSAASPPRSEENLCCSLVEFMMENYFVLHRKSLDAINFLQNYSHSYK
ncbi:MAG: hypothetical protein KIG59_00930, partial [Muribaculaceae bacterium]|nr:hypothetical protein [Muribaculaceae bacterium]